jgi:head-tail adaptor
MKAGRMRHRITLQEPVRDVDGFVGEVKTFADVVEVSASIDPFTGREGFGVDRELAGIDYRITLRNPPGIHVQADWRAVDVDTGAIYELSRFVASHDRAVLIVLASSGTAQP